MHWSVFVLNTIMNEYVQSISKTKQSKLKESPVVGPHTRVEPANGFLSWMFSWKPSSFSAFYITRRCNETRWDQRRQVKKMGSKWTRRQDDSKQDQTRRWDKVGQEDQTRQECKTRQDKKVGWDQPRPNKKIRPNRTRRRNQTKQDQTRNWGQTKQDQTRRRVVSHDWAGSPDKTRFTEWLSLWVGVSFISVQLQQERQAEEIPA